MQASGMSPGDDGKQQQRVPWKNVFSSLSVWAILVAGMGNTWGIAIFYAQLPTYMKNILGFSIKAVSTKLLAESTRSLLCLFYYL